MDWLFSKGIKRGEAPLRISLPSPLYKGRGIKGEGLLTNLLLREGGQGDRLPNNPLTIAQYIVTLKSVIVEVF